MCMWSKHHGSHLHALAFGLALAVAYGLAVLVMLIIIMVGYAPAEMAAMHTDVTWQAVLTHVLWALLEGFIFGWVLAFLYNCFACCVAMCCNKSNGECGCSCHSSEKNPDMK